MRSEVPTLLSLSEFATIMGLNPFRVAGYCTNVPEVAFSGERCCDGHWFEYTYQNNALSRQDVASAIYDAEQTFADAIGFWPAPHYAELESHKYPGATGYYQADGSPKSVTLKYGKLNQFGKQTRVVLDDDASAILTNPLGLSVRIGGSDVPIPDTFTVSVAVPGGTLPEEMELYFTETDRLGEARRKWQIKPISVVILSGVAVITGRSWLLAPPELVKNTKAICMDARVDYVDSVEVVRVVTDATDVGLFYWPTAPCSTPPCAESSYTLCSGIKDADFSVITPTPALWNEENEVFKIGSPPNCAPPTKVKINYTSGYPRTEDGEMDADIASIIAHLAASFLDCESCACRCTKERLDKFQKYETIKVSDTGYRPVLPEKNPFGERYGAMRAWREARRYRQKIG